MEKENKKKTDEKITELCETIKALPDDGLMYERPYQGRRGFVPCKFSTNDLQLLADRYEQMQAMLAAANEMPLCPVHKRLDEIDGLELCYGNGCVACSLNERNELLDLLAPFANGGDSITVLKQTLAAITEEKNGK